MTSDDAELEARADALRRIVYGTPDGYASGAADELESLEAELAQRADERERAALPARAEEPRPDERRPGEASERAKTGGDPADLGVDADHPLGAEAGSQSAAGHPVASATRPRWGRLGTRVTSGLAIGAVIAGFAVVGGVAVVNLTAPERGLAVFDRPQRPDDESLTVALGAQADTVRRIDEVFGRGFWAYLNGVDQVCLSVVPVGTSLVERGECASRARFEEHGIVVQYAASELGAHRPDGTGERDVVVISWSPESDGVTWELVLIDPPAPDPMTFDEWSNSREAAS
ncbi:hypothetical protein [Agromyces italicus]|uniref:hypothetical protein n=1 Tax=Agromyces italicus TaxID=279572 RepID=UPI0003B7B4B8|nr:hypothetical protein [Agromyces italicus]